MAGKKITAEVCVHHLWFDDTDYERLGGLIKCNPAIKKASDKEALWKALLEDRIDIIATDHAPHTPFEKRQDFASAPFGITGLETALVSLYDRFISKGTFGWDLIVKRYSAEPRRIMKLQPVPIIEGGIADFILFNPARSTTFSRDFMKSKSINTPFIDQTLQGMIERVMYRGEELLVR